MDTYRAEGIKDARAQFFATALAWQRGMQRQWGCYCIPHQLARAIFSEVSAPWHGRVFGLALTAGRRRVQMPEWILSRTYSSPSVQPSQAL